MFDTMSPNLESIVLDDARLLALSSKHDRVHPEHMLLGILAKDCVASKILSKKADFEKIAASLVPLIEAIPAASGELPEKPGFSEESKKVLDGAHEEATRLGYEMIGTEHLVLSIMANYEPIRKLLKDKFEITYGWLIEVIGRAPKGDAAQDTSASAGGAPAGKKTVRISTIMAGVFFESQMSERDIETALFAIEQIKGVVFTQPMQTPQTPQSRTPTIGG